MRIRQVKPSFFKDALMAELSPPVRLFYVGTWMLADDAGWLTWDVAEVGNELYGYEPRGRRERNATAYLDALIDAKRITRYEGCDHLSIPKFAEHQRLAGLTKQVRTVFKEHEKECVPKDPAHPRDDPHSPGTVRNGRGKGTGTEDGAVRNGSERNARMEETESEFRRLTGLPSFLESTTDAA